MDGPGKLIELSYHGLALHYKVGAVFHQFPVPKIELALFSAPLPDQPEEVISLKENLVIPLEGTKISRIDLAVCQVQVTATKRWGTANKVDVLGAKDHHIDLTDEVDGAAGHAIDPDPLLNMYRFIRAMVCPHKGDLHPKAPTTFLNLG
jgi:hypothetical protein